MKNKYILGSINIFLNLIIYILLILGLYKLDLITKNIIIILSIFIFIILFISLLSYLSKNKNIYNICQFISFLINIILAFNIYTIEHKYSYYTNLITNKYEYIDYNIYIQSKNTTYSNIDKLKSKKIAIVSSNDQILNELNNKDINIIEYRYIVEIEEALSSGNTQAIIINNKEYEQLSSNTKSKIKKIHTIKVKERKN